MARDEEIEEFSGFVASTQRTMVRFGELLTGDRGRAEDLAQHGFARAYAAWPRIRGGDPAAYVRRCILNAHTDWWRRRTWRERPSEVLPEAAEGADFTSISADRAVVLRALARLTERERAVVALRFLFDLSEAQVAAELGVAAGTVKSGTARALAKLRADAELRAETAR